MNILVQFCVQVIIGTTVYVSYRLVKDYLGTGYGGAPGE